MENKVIELIELYEAILHGNENYMGVFDCYDTYYKGCWDEKLKQVQKLKSEIVKKLTIPDVVGQSEQLVCECSTNNISGVVNGVAYCEDCEQPKAN